jgi:hypothetical protein
MELPSPQSLEKVVVTDEVDELDFEEGLTLLEDQELTKIKHFFDMPNDFTGASRLKMNNADLEENEVAEERLVTYREFQTLNDQEDSNNIEMEIL